MESSEEELFEDSRVYASVLSSSPPRWKADECLETRGRRSLSHVVMKLDTSGEFNFSCPAGGSTEYFAPRLFVVCQNSIRIRMKNRSRMTRHTNFYIYFNTTILSVFLDLLEVLRSPYLTFAVCPFSRQSLAMQKFPGGARIANPLRVDAAH